MTRTDPHRPGAIIPTDYVGVLWYSLATTFEGWPQPSLGITCQRRVVTEPGPFGPVHREVPDQSIQHAADGRCCVIGLGLSGAKWAPTGGTGKCSVCGACYIYGEVWQHQPTGEHIHIGHDCADKYGLAMDRSEWETWHAEQTRLRSLAAKDKKYKMAAHKFLEDKPELSSALALGVDPADGEARQVAILRDMREKLNRYGSMSDRATTFALKLADELRNPVVKEEEKHVPAPEGRVKFSGKVVSTKVYDGVYGSTIKMTVKVETPDGSWLAWLTMPSSIDVQRGQEVEVTATLTRGSDAHFAFGKRPTGARVVA